MAKLLKLNINELKNSKYEKSINVEEVSNKEIAIIGLYVSFPQANDKEEFWLNLKNGVDSIKEFPMERRQDVENYLRFKGNTSEELEYEKGAYFDNVDGFDNQYFHLSPKEAGLMDPNQRLFLKAAWGAIEDAGYGEKKIKSSKTGVYIGYCEALNSYRNLIKEVDPTSISISLPGNLASMIASRISYLLDLKGPAVSIDTACSSSLLALNIACQSLRNKECDMAMVGGVRLNLLPVVRENKFGIESSDGKAKTFDNSSDGTGQGEGVVAMLLKPLNKAEEDRDNIYAVIKGFASNQDGASIGITAPNVEAQEQVIVDAWRDADIEPETISYIEAHGTGTKLGDPIEIDGIERAFRRYTDKKQFCAIGSVKTNIGHLDNAAGIAGLVKAVLALKYQEIPPSIHFKRPNQKIDFASSPVYVNDVLRKWEKDNFLRRCGVSSFGLSGTNCHVVLEEYVRKQKTKDICNGLNVLALSAGTKEGIEQLLKEYSRLLKKDTDRLRDICYSANTGRGHYNYRLIIIVKDKQDLEEKISRLLKEKNTINENWHFENENINSKQLSNEEKTDINSKAEKKVKEILDDGSPSFELLEELCLLYVKGADINWDELYKNQKQYRVSVPVYPFNNKRCWLDIPEYNLNFLNINNLIDTDYASNGLLDEIKSVIDKWDKTTNKNISDDYNNISLDVNLEGRENNDYSYIEKVISNIWKETLGIETINIYQSFYEIGGDSLLLMNVTNMINKSLNIQIKMSEAVVYQTVESLSKHIEQNYQVKNSNNNNKIIKDKKSGDLIIDDLNMI